jgi:uncharacterized protein
MTNPLNIGPLSETEFDRLEEILFLSEDRGLSVEGVDGLFAALVCSPVEVGPAEWLPHVWGGEPPEFITREEVQEAMGLLTRMWNHVADSIEEGTFGPLFSSGIGPDGSETVTPHLWCLGFVEGMRVHESHWFNESNEEIQDLVLPIGMVAMDAAVLFGEAPDGEEQLSPEKLNRFSDLIPDVVAELHQYWLDHPV